VNEHASRDVSTQGWENSSRDQGDLRLRATYPRVNATKWCMAVDGCGRRAPNSCRSIRLFARREA